MDINRKQQAAQKIAEILADGIRDNLQEFDNELRMIDTAEVMIMAETIVLDRMYECNMVNALGIVKNAVNNIGIKKQED